MSDQTEVLYNDRCPVCSREIRQYERMTQKQALKIRFDGLDDDTRLKDWQITKDEAARRLHVRKAGQIYGGIPAFMTLWQQMPQMSWLAKIVSLPGAYWASCLIYDRILAPVLYRWHKRREIRSNGA